MWHILPQTPELCGVRNKHLVLEALGSALDERPRPFFRLLHRPRRLLERPLCPGELWYPPALVFRAATFLALLEPRPPPLGTPTGEGKAGAGCPPCLSQCWDRSTLAGEALLGLPALL